MPRAASVAARPPPPPALLLALPLLLAVAASAAPGAAALPNIIWLQVDSMDGRLLDPTHPYFYKLRAEGFHVSVLSRGANFARHYTNSPQCVPSRTGMMTSRYVSDTGTTNNGQGLARSTKTGALDSGCVSLWNASTCARFAERQNVSATMLDLVAAAGYELRLFGRFDVGAGITDDYANTTGSGFHSGPDLHILARGAGITGITDVEPWSSTVSNAAHPYAPDVSVAAEAVQWLESTPPPAPGDKPFFLWVGLLDPHPPYDSNATYRAHLNESNIDAPTLPAWESMHPFDRSMSVLKACTLNYTDAQLKVMRANYWGAAAEALSLLERVVAAANASGHLDNTVVIFTSDHGEMSMEHRQDYKNSLREPSTRVPLVIAPYGRAAQQWPDAAGSVVTALTSHVDIVPTIAELAGGAPGLPLSRGASLVPLLAPPARRSARSAARAAARSDFIVAEYHSNLASTGSFMIRQGDYKLIVFGHSWPWFNATAFVPQLFNVAADAFELENVAAENPALIASMLAQLETELGGGPGAVAAVDRAQMAENLELFKAFFADRMPFANLTRAVAEAFKGPTEAEVAARLTQWLGGL